MTAKNIVDTFEDYCPLCFTTIAVKEIFGLSDDLISFITKNFPHDAFCSSNNEQSPCVCSYAEEEHLSTKKKKILERQLKAVILTAIENKLEI